MFVLFDLDTFFMQERRNCPFGPVALKYHRDVCVCVCLHWPWISLSAHTHLHLSRDNGHDLADVTALWFDVSRH